MYVYNLIQERGEKQLIQYRINVLEELKERGYNTNRLRKEKLIGETNIQYIREGKPVGVKVLDTLCRLLDCQPSYIYKYVEDEQSKK